jgi:histidinol-phosphate phosphatase family protein
MTLDGDLLHFGCGSGMMIDSRTSESDTRVTVDQALDPGDRQSLETPIAAAFLDRDGTLNIDVHRLATPDQLELLPGTAEGLRRLNHAGLRSVVVTNQSAVARGELTEATLEKIHEKLQSLLEKNGAHLTAIYHCPHHPDVGLPGGHAALKIRCGCRKPAIGMIERAVADLSIDVANSWMIGDTTTDLQTARNAGLRSVLVRTGYGGRDGRWRIRPDYEFFDLKEAAKFIVDQHPKLLDQARAILPACDPGSLVAIGGLARSGKSTWASILSEALADRGQRAVILPLDSWLRSATDRRPGHVMGRYDVDEISSLVERLSGRTKRVEVQLGHYDRFARERSEDGCMVEIEPGDIVLWEGVPALAIPALASASSITFHVECPENVRRQRFDREHALRGLSDSGIELLYREREADEHSIIRGFGAEAEFRIDGGS